jgi:hypothetical protein
MTITTQQGVVDGLQYPVKFTKFVGSSSFGNRPRSWWQVAGYPTSAATPAVGLAGAALTSYAGQIPFNNPVSGNTYLAQLDLVPQSAIGLNVHSSMTLLCDRLWHNNAINVSVTTTQTINSVTWPARDNNQSINGEGIYIALEVTTATGAGANVPEITYTNSAGTGGRVGRPVVTYPGTSGASSFYFFGLQAGDTGVRSVQLYRNSVTMTSGAVSLVALRVIGATASPVSRVAKKDALALGFPRLWNDSVPFLVGVSKVVDNHSLHGTLRFAQG